MTYRMEGVTNYIGARTEGEVYRTTVTEARAALSATTCQLLVDEGEQLVVRASAPQEVDELPTISPLSLDDLTQAYAQDATHVIDDLTHVRSAAASPTPSVGTDHIRSLMIVPHDSVGLFLATDTRPAHFTDGDAERVAQLLSYADIALDRIHAQARRNARGDRFVEIISTYVHDLRTPLQLAAGHLDLARKSGDSEHFQRVIKAHDRLEELLEDMAHLAETGKRVGDVDAVDLRRTAEKAWMALPAANATLDISDTRTIQADESKLRQLLENLFKNAVEHGPRDVRIRVGTHASGFFVEDDGPGIPEEHRDAVFEWNTTFADNHTGVGLSIVKDIADAHNWEITIGESGIGGARFDITT